MKEDVLSAGFELAHETVQDWINGFYTILPNLVVGVFILLLFGAIAYSIGKTVFIYFYRKDRIDLGHILESSCFWGIIILGVLVSLTIIMPSLKPADLLASLGIGSLAIGFAFKDILQNWLAGLLILLRLPFRRGDQIRVGEAEGTVMRIEPRATIIMTYDGRDIVIPNTEIYTNMVIIHTSHEYRRVEIDFTVGYAYEIREITEIIRRALVSIEEIMPKPPPQILCWELGSTSLGIKVRWWIRSERAQEIISRSRAIQAIKEAFDANNIDPTDPQLIYYRYIENSVQKSLAPSLPEDVEPDSPEAPFKVIFSPDDPEVGKPKQDSKEDTLLPER